MRELAWLDSYWRLVINKAIQLDPWRREKAIKERCDYLIIL
jgi:hypothetical protein